MAGCGHLAFITQPERVASLVSRFLSAGSRVGRGRGRSDYLPRS
jgi:hypothetical protein